MRKFLRSPLAVAIMALLAAGIVYNNVIAPLQSKSTAINMPMDEPATYTIAPTEATAYSTLVWQLRDNDRNPFSPLVTPKKISQKIRTTTPQIKKEVPQQLYLSAILSDSHSPLALISGQLVGLHDAIAGFTVVNIQQNRVRLQGKGTHKTLFLPQDSRR